MFPRARRFVLIALAGCCFAPPAFGEDEPCTPKSDLGTISRIDLTRSDTFRKRIGSCFSDGFFADVFTFTGTAGQIVTFAVSKGGHFTGTPTLAIAKDVNSPALYGFTSVPPFKLTFALPNSGSFIVVVSSIEPYVTGDYTLKVKEGASVSANSASTDEPSAAADKHTRTVPKRNETR